MNPTSFEQFWDSIITHLDVWEIAFDFAEIRKFRHREKPYQEAYLCIGTGTQSSDVSEMSCEAGVGFSVCDGNDDTPLLTIRVPFETAKIISRYLLMYPENDPYG